jgi:hypothetical protein
MPTGKKDIQYVKDEIYTKLAVCLGVDFLDDPLNVLDDLLPYIREQHEDNKRFQAHLDAYFASGRKANIRD